MKAKDLEVGELYLVRYSEKKEEIWLLIEKIYVTNLNGCDSYIYKFLIGKDKFIVPYKDNTELLLKKIN